MFLECYTQFESVFEEIKNENLTFELAKPLDSKQKIAPEGNLLTVVGAHTGVWGCPH